jgi:hypothetical protein
MRPACVECTEQRQPINHTLVNAADSGTLVKSTSKPTVIAVAANTAPFHELNVKPTAKTSAVVVTSGYIRAPCAYHIFAGAKASSRTADVAARLLMPRRLARTHTNPRLQTDASVDGRRTLASDTPARHSVVMAGHFRYKGDRFHRRKRSRCCSERESHRHVPPHAPASGQPSR